MAHDIEMGEKFGTLRPLDGMNSTWTLSTGRCRRCGRTIGVAQRGEHRIIFDGITGPQTDADTVSFEPHRCHAAD